MADPVTSTESPERPLARWLLPSFGSLLVLTALVNALFLRGGMLFSWDGDATRHIRVGRAIIERGGILHADHFTHTRPGVEYVPYEWLSQTILGQLDMLFGLPGAAVFAALLHAAAVLGAYRVAQELGAPRLFALGVGLLALLLQSLHLLARPHMFTTVLAALFIIVLLRFARTGRPWVLLPLPVLMLFWVNAHPGFPIGFVLLTAFIIGALLGSSEFVSGRRGIRPLVLTLAACATASLVNPAGIGMWAHTTDLLGSDFIISVTEEFQSLDFHTGYGKLFFVALFAGPATWMTGRVRVSWLAAGLYLLFAASALHTARNVTLFTVIALPFTAVWLEDALRGGGSRAASVLRRVTRWEEFDRRLLPYGWMVVGGALVWFATGPGSAMYRIDPDRFPVAALATLEGAESWGPVFNQMEWGGYMVYVRPEIPIFIDGMTNVYGEELSRDYITVASGLPGWRRILDTYDVAWTLTRRQAPINQLLELHEDWRRVHTDKVAVVYRRDGRP